MRWIWSEKRPGSNGKGNRPAASRQRGHCHSAEARMRWIWSENRPGGNGRKRIRQRPAEGPSPLGRSQNEVDLEREEPGKPRGAKGGRQRPAEAGRRKTAGPKSNSFELGKNP